jgi:predicted component of type VI protein secretion system
MPRQRSDFLDESKIAKQFNLSTDLNNSGLQ